MCFILGSILGWFYENKIPVTVTENELKLLNSLSNRRWLSNYKDLILGDVLFRTFRNRFNNQKNRYESYLGYGKNSNLNLKLSRLIDI